MVFIIRLRDVHTYVTDKEDLDKILSVLSAASYRERLYNEESGTIFNCMSLIIFGENWTAEMTVYPENLVDVCVSSDEDGSLTYYISDENVNFEEFKALLTEMREKYGIGPHK